jgi:hypothetical protein
MTKNFKYVLIILAIIVIPFLTAIILFGIPFATIYFSIQLFKQPAIPEEKPAVNFFDFAIKNFKKNGI